MADQDKELNKREVDEMFDHITSVPGSETDEEEPTKRKAEEEEVEKPEEEISDSGESEEEAPSDEPEEDEVVAQLRSKVAELETGKAFGPQGEEVETKETKEEPKAEEEEKQKLEDFITEEEFDEIQTNPNKMNEILNKVYQRARNSAYQDALKDIPDVVSTTQQRQQNLRNTIQKFYADNPELADYGKYVGYEANRIKSENPDKPLEDVLNEAGEVVKKELKISEVAKDKEQQRREDEEEQGQGPAFAKRGSGRREGPKVDTRNDFDKQADAMLAAINK